MSFRTLHSKLGSEYHLVGHIIIPLLMTIWCDTLLRAPYIMPKKESNVGGLST